MKRNRRQKRRKGELSGAAKYGLKKCRECNKNWAKRGKTFCKLCASHHGENPDRPPPKGPHQRTFVRPKYHEYIESAEWRRKRLAAIRKAKGCCATCGATEDLQVHHLHYKSLGREKLRDLQVLCVSCHSLEHEDKHLPKDELSKEFRRMFR